jgi:heptosyltransferase-2/heptosyltransferase-3
MGTPTTAIFGPSKSVETAPYGNRHRVAEKKISCRGTCDESVCRYSRFHACMADLSVADVFEKVERLLKDLTGDK